MAKSRPDDVKLVLNNIKQEGISGTIHKVLDRLQVPISLGYSSAGVVVEGDGFKAGTTVACIGESYACHAETVGVPAGYVVEIPANVPLDQAAFTGIGAIALQGLRQANPQLGEWVGVIGLGLVGQILVQTLKANGNRVFGIDPDQSRVQLALSCGMDAGSASGDITDIKALTNNLTRNNGLDAVVITAASPDATPLEWAGVLSREKGRVVILGALPIHIPRKDYYEKELSVSLSRAFGAGSYDPAYAKGDDYPIGYVRWTARRNMESFLELIAQKKIDLNPLITHRVPFEKGKEAYELLTSATEKPLGIVFDYSNTPASQPLKRLDMPASSIKKGKKTIGAIGMGNFAQTYLMPRLKKASGIGFGGVVTARGMTAKHAAKKFGFSYCSTDAQQVLDDNAADAVLIATRHNSHASLVVETLRRKKLAYVEKPLALTEPELEKIRDAAAKNSGWIMVGFNRRFSSHTQLIKTRLKDSARPFNLNIRVNAGPLPAGHWLGKEDEGGGRLLGEGCHFVDWAQYLVGQAPVSVRVDGSPAPHDDFEIHIRYADGSLATIQYLTRGDVTFGRERLEIFGTGFSASIDDFRKSVWCGGLKKTTHSTFSKDLGYNQSMAAFSDALLNGKMSPTPFSEIYLSTLTTIRAREALATGKEITLDQIQWNQQ